MKSRSTFAAALLAVGLLSSPAHAEEQPSEVTIGYLNLVNAQLLAKALGLHEKELGVPVRWVKFGSGGDVNRAVAADQLDFGGVGNPPASIGITRELPYEGIFVLNMLGAVEGLVGRKSAGVATVKDLVGKSVAVPFGSTTHYLLIAALRDAGIKPSDVKMLDMSPSDAAAAWLRKDIDAAYVWEPSLGRMLDNDGQSVLHSADMARRGYPTWDVAVVMKRFSSKYPALTARFVKAECAAIDYWIAKPAESAQLIAKELNLSVDDATRMMKGTTMVPCSDQVKSAYLGSSATKGQFADTLVATAGFLKDQNRLPATKTRNEYAAFLNPAYLERVLSQK
ncbi:ABC transporter substrate-binding protein [Niveibacterium sp. SC-1]|uniref:taurine ABC transporter substrate-binding protein n=1 Tax=Niveibacterium sp. SC-1 TaxID=3135646 RepID=UPI00311DA086